MATAGQASTLTHPCGYISGTLGDRHAITAQLEALYRDIHPDWLVAAQTAMSQHQQMPSIDAVVAMLLPRLGWSEALSAPITLDTITGRAATFMQLGPLQPRRQQQCHSQYVQGSSTTALCLCSLLKHAHSTDAYGTHSDATCHACPVHLR